MPDRSLTLTNDRANQQVAIEFRDVSFCLNHRPKDRQLVKQLDFEIYQGEFLVLLGQSGCGKTTTLKLINRLLDPSQGEVLVEGKSTKVWQPIQLRRRIGYVIQETGLFPHFTVAQNIGLVPSLENWSLDRITGRINQLLIMVGLPAEEFADRYPHQLSGGQRQRVGVARALAADPPILLMDEPFGALDLLTRMEMQRELKHLQQQLGKTIVFVTHDIQEALFLGSRIGLMHEGRLVELCTRSDFLRSTVPQARIFIECLNDLQRLAI